MAIVNTPRVQGVITARDSRPLQILQRNGAGSEPLVMMRFRPSGEDCTITLVAPKTMAGTIEVGRLIEVDIKMVSNVRFPNSIHFELVTDYRYVAQPSDGKEMSV